MAPKPSVARMATGGAGPEEAGQGSPVAIKKMIPTQSSRPPSAASATVAQQGERAAIGHNLLLSSSQRVPLTTYTASQASVFFSVTDD